MAPAADPGAITTGPHDDVWFTTTCGSSGSIGQIDTSGTVTTFTGTNIDFPHRITAGRNAARAARVDALVKKVGFLSFGHWSSSPGSRTRSASDALLQSIDLAVAAEELGADGAYFRVHHFARQLGSPFPLLAAVGARTGRIEIGTAVIDMRYENPLYMAEDAGDGRPHRPPAASSWGSAAAHRSR